MLSELLGRSWFMWSVFIVALLIGSISFASICTSGGQVCAALATVPYRKTSTVSFGAEQVVYGTAPDTSAATDMTTLGLKVIRFPINWGAQNPANGTIYWSASDGVAAAAKTAGLQVEFTIYGSPKWVSGSSNYYYIPVSGSTLNAAWLSAYTTFFNAVIARYGSPSTPGTLGSSYASVIGYQVWNEPNTNYVGSFWNENGSTSSTPQATVYAQMFNAIYAAGKVVNSSVTIGTAGIAALTYWSDGGATTGVTYITNLIGLSMMTPDFVGIHPYTGGSPNQNPLTDNNPTGNSFGPDIARVQSAMVSGGWGNVPIWITEFGQYKQSVNGSQTNATYMVNAFNAVDKIYSQVGASNAPVTVCLYYQLNNSDWGLFSGTTATATNIILPAGSAVESFMTGNPIAGIVTN